ncbi:glutathione S-transferase N-terminal domain-containing protein [Cognatiyoonia sp. IB215182]|uniref:glutathione S-transferase N-terminal domain-containing protein n=1 Tax=Cognatiyoonia sp. IB215182 TaxID=3097353 RepID=UPI002A0C1B97|nr:glutathione S-transferase N-terminal domain-containing protein [Cognatiyoonia sp. IB215182]MDX8355206.1 glutathione S-transferase N-terminal domain-containing protein [Cognatiyoonia sp. IB215182]
MTTNSIRLFPMPDTCALAPNIAAIWAGVAVVVVNLVRGDNRKPAHVWINPRGQVPALEIAPGEVLTEAAAILRYIADLTPKSTLYQAEPPQRAREAEALS